MTVHYRDYCAAPSYDIRGCPCQLTSIFRDSSIPVGDRTQVVNEYTSMVLRHLSKTNQIKNTLPLAPIHHQLEIESLSLYGSGASNILLSKVSFDCLIIDSSGEERRDYITFDLKIPGANNAQEPVFTLENIRKKYGSVANLYAALKHFFLLGRSCANPTNKKHGNEPAYDSRIATDDRFIRHTEQFLVAYLALPEAAQMLAKRLIAEIRAKYTEAAEIKVYNMGLHMHSTKTCCPVCEYCLIGLMNERQEVRRGGKIIGFIPNFTQACSERNELLSISLPKKSTFRLLVTVSADERGRGHKKLPEYVSQLHRVTISVGEGSKESLMVGEKDKDPYYDIPVKDDRSSCRIFTALFESKYDVRKLPANPSLSDMTVCISGSKETPGSPGTMKKVKKVKEEEMNQLEVRVSSLKIESFIPGHHIDLIVRRDF